MPEGGGGVGFTEKYNGNRFYKAGLSTDGLSEGEVMFLQNGATTTMFAAVTHVALPEAGIDWTKFTKIGTIEVRNGGTPAVISRWSLPLTTQVVTGWSR